MSSRHAVVSGASIAGLSAAFWLRRTGWDVTVIEKAAAFRDGGQNVDLRGVAHEVLDRMGLTDAVRAANTHETATVLVDAEGGVVAQLPSEGRDGATAELEILRGDLARVLLDALPTDVAFVFGDTVERVEDGADAVTVTTRGGVRLTADLLVVAEGVRSSTRPLVFGDEPDLDDLGITMVFGTIPRTADDDRRWRWFTATGGRQVHLRPDNHGTTRAVLAYDRGEDLTGVDLPQAMTTLRRRFAGAGWQTPRVLDGLAASDDVYLDRLTQVRTPTWHRGRVSLVGDAAWCVTPLGGGGASLALTAGYVLAAYLSAAPTGDPAGALARFETWMRPLVDDVQKLPPGLHALAYPRTPVGLAARNVVMKAVTSRPLRKLTERLTNVADTDAALPALVD